MIVRVVEQACLSGAIHVVVGTDDARIYDAVKFAGYETVMTSTTHRSGSDRVMEVVDKLGWSDENIVVNVQGDEPLIKPQVISQVASLLAASPKGDDFIKAGVATLYAPIEDKQVLFDPNAVKLVVDIEGKALYFSRAPIPWPGQDSDIKKSLSLAKYKRHIGIYAYRVSALQRFVTLPLSYLENQERLEQLRLLENGMHIVTQEACEQVHAGIDTPADYDRICALFASR